MAERFIPEHRRTQYKAKNTFKPDELRRRREEQQVEIRKAKREENLAKRRGIAGRDGTQMSAPGASLGASIDSDDEGGTIESQVRKREVVHASSFSLSSATRVTQLPLDMVSIQPCMRCPSLEHSPFSVTVDA